MEPMTIRWVRDDLVRVQATHERHKDGRVVVPSLLDVEAWAQEAVRASLGAEVAFSLVVVSSQERRSWDADALPGRTDVTYRVERREEG